MTHSKNKSKKLDNKKPQVHAIPKAKIAKGRRPHTEVISENLSPSDFQSSSNISLEGSSLKSEPGESAERATSSQANQPNHPEELSGADRSKFAGASTGSEFDVAKEEVILEGKPAPGSTAQSSPHRSKVDLKNHIESVKGMMQMGTAIVKSSFPKPFEIAEKVVENWKDDGDFSELPIEQPLLQFYLGLGLRKAKATEKEIESKLETTGVLPVFRQQWNKAQKLFNK